MHRVADDSSPSAIPFGVLLLYKPRHNENIDVIKRLKKIWVTFGEIDRQCERRLASRRKCPWATAPTALCIVREVTSTKSTAKLSSKPKSASSSTKADTRYFELVDDKSNKFWEISVGDEEVTVRHGRIGSNGAAKTTTFADIDAATAHARKLIDQKANKGYVEK